jgi:glycosyltransferase involved in cell wall biosynthesis
MKIAYITAGAANMYCGSCMHDNTLAAALIAQGHDALLIPSYTPIRTDEVDVSQHRVFFGGINVYLQQKSSFFRRTPRFLDRLLDFPRLLRWVSGFAVKVQAEELGALTVAMLQGDHGPIRKEAAKLADWLAAEVKPDILNLSNAMIVGMVPHVKRKVKAPILVTLQGDDIFLDALIEPYRTQAMQLLRDLCGEVDGFLSTSAYYADHMASYLGINRQKIHVVYPGLNLKGHGASRSSPNGDPMTIGYFARICPEKGLHVLVEAFHLLKQMSDAPPARLRISGYLGANNQAYFDELQQRIKNWGLSDLVEHVESPDHASKLRFLQSLDILSVPTTYREPKGLYILEALANGVPVVQPRHGSFPELIEATGGGLLVEPDNPADLAKGLRRLLDDPGHRRELARKGQEAVHGRFHAANMASETVAVYQKYLPRDAA